MSLKGFSPLNLRGLIEARSALLTMALTAVFSPLNLRGLIEATGRDSPCRRRPGGFSPLNLRGLIEALRTRNPPSEETRFPR